MASSPDRRRFSNFFGALIARLVTRWQAWASPDRYRPKKHYMRGPGPKASAKVGGDNNSDAA